MTNWRISIGLLSIDVEAANWLTALGLALPQAGMEPGALGGLVCAMRPDGGVSAHDPVIGVELVVERVPSAPGEASVPPPSSAVDPPPDTSADDESVAAPTQGRLEAVQAASLAERLEDLFLLCGQISDATDSVKACDAALDVAQRLIVAEACSILLKEPNGSRMRFVASRGAGADKVLNSAIPVDVGLAGFAVAFNVGLLVDDAQADVRHYKQVDRATGHRSRAVLAVPVRSSEGTMFGCMELVNPPDRFTADDLQVAAAVAQSLGAVLVGSTG